MREYKISKLKITINFLLTLFFIVLIFWILVPLNAFNEGLGGGSMLNSIMKFFLLGMALLTIIESLKLPSIRFVINHDKVFIKNTFLYKHLNFNEIKGYRATKNHLSIESNSKQKKHIKISKDFEKLDEIEAWLSANFTNLDIEDAYQYKEEVFNKFSDLSKEHWDEKLVTAQKIAKILNWIGVAVGICTLLLTYLYEYAIIASIVFPIICLIVMKYFGGIIKIDFKKNQAYPTVFGAIVVNAMALFLRAMIYFKIFDYSNLWTPLVFITITYIAILVVDNEEFKFNKTKDFLLIIGCSIFMFLYSYGTVVTLNGMLDESEPEKYNATVLSKYVRSGKYYSYHLELSPWGPQKEIELVSVSKDLFNTIYNNDIMVITYKKGRFDIPYYEMTK